MIDLKPCPFCGETSVSKTIRNGWFYEAICDQCYATVGGISKEEMVHKWNRRVLVPPMNTEIKRKKK
jgi:restriction alleviation protein, Lar family